MREEKEKRELRILREIEREGEREREREKGGGRIGYMRGKERTLIDR